MSPDSIFFGIVAIVLAIVMLEVCWIAVRPIAGKKTAPVPEVAPQEIKAEPQENVLKRKPRAKAAEPPERKPRVKIIEPAERKSRVKVAEPTERKTRARAVKLESTE